MDKQLSLFAIEEKDRSLSATKAGRSGTFVDNMNLPIHRWFRYSAGFAAQWVEEVVTKWGIAADQMVLDPFAGSGTVPIVCDALGLQSIGVEAHPVVARILRAKLSWATPVEHFTEFAEAMIEKAGDADADVSEYPSLIHRSYEAPALKSLDRLKWAWLGLADGSPESELAWLALTAILRPTSTAGTAQWQYILPNKTKKKVTLPETAFRQQIGIMRTDMQWMQFCGQGSRAKAILGDARACASLITGQVDAVITSPPYANNYDYADALRFEMSFWGEVDGWGDIHDKVRKHLIVSSSQHASRERLECDELLSSPEIGPIRDDLAAVVHELASVRQSHGGKKHYHTMVAAYCRDIAIVLRQLRSVCSPHVRMCWVIGDSAPYGVYCPIDEWIGALALAEGFQSYRFEKLRDRNIKWKNRKHRVPLKEGVLWIEG